MVDKKVNIITRVIPKKPRSKNFQGSGITNIANYAGSNGGTTSVPQQPSIEVLPSDSYSNLTDDNVLSSLRTIKEIIARIIQSGSDVDATEENTYSAIKIDKEIDALNKEIDALDKAISTLDNKFLHKDKTDKTEFLLKLLGGVEFKDGTQIDTLGNAILESIITRKKITANEIEALLNLKSKNTTTENLSSKSTTTLNLVVKQLAKAYDLSVENTATILKEVVKESLTSPTFRSGLLGEGFKLAKAVNGDWNLEIDNLIVRKVFQVFELIIQEVKHQGGVVVHSPAGGKITKVTDGGSYWKCEVESADTFFKDDLVLCQKFTGKNIKRYWRLATSAGDGFVNLSKTDFEANSAIPEVDDEIATLGSKTNAARQSAYLISVVGADAPYTAYYSGINSYSLKGKEHTRIGNLEGVVSPVFGPLKGSGALLENAYIQGIVKLQNGKTVETVISETSNKLSSDIGKVRTELKGDISKSKEETKGEINSSVSSVRNELNSTIAKAEEQFNTGINQTKTELSSNISSVKQELEGKINTDIQVSKESITKQITQSKQEAEAAAKAYTDAQDKAKLTQAQSYADGKVATEQKRAIEDVNAKLTAAKSYADAADAKLKTEQQAYADGKVTATEEKLLQTANDNLAAAKAYAEAQDEALKVKTDAYADGKITAEEKRAIADANAKLAAAKKYAEAQDNLLKTQQEAYADGKVTASEKRAIADATNKVNAAKSELNALVSKAQSTADDAKDAIDGLEIGGRNIAVLSYLNLRSDVVRDGYNLTMNVWARQIWGKDYVSKFFQGGTRYTISYTVNVLKIVGDGALSKQAEGEFALYSGSNLTVMGRIGVDKYADVKVGDSFKVSQTFTTPKNIDGYYILYYSAYRKGGYDYHLVKDLKIEKGNKPTDWTPAPEDIENQISEVETSIKKEITTVEQRFQIAEGQINGKITETTQLVNEAKTTSGETKKTLEQTTARINQFDITAKKFEGTLGEISKKQGEVESSITNLNATANSLNASVNGFKETEQQIKATANKIEASHEGIVLEASEKSAQKAIDGLEIGGRNLISGSGGVYLKRLGAYGRKIVEYNGKISVLHDRETMLHFAAKTTDTIKKGGSYVYSFKMCCNEGIVKMASHIYINGKEGSIRSVNDTEITTEWKMFYISSVAKGDIKEVAIHHYLAKTLTDTDQIVYLTEYKLEKGTKPTDWTPAPEDIDAQFTETKASLKVLNDKLVAEVSKTNGISKDLTAVKQDHNSFKVQVKTDISGAINSNNEVILSSFKMDGNKIGIGGKYIDLTGKVTFSALNSESQNKINTATKTANNAAQDIFDLKLEVGDLAYLNTVEKAQLGTTVIEGGFLRTDLLQAKSIKAEKLDIEEITDNTIVGGFVFLNGSMISQEGIDKYGNPSNDWGSYKDGDFMPNLVMKPIDGSIKAMKGSFGIFDIVDESIVGRSEAGGDEAIRVTTDAIPEAIQFTPTWSITSFESLVEKSTYYFLQDNQNRQNTYKKSVVFNLPISEIGEYQLSSVSAYVAKVVNSNSGADASSYVKHIVSVICIIKQHNNIIKKVTRNIVNTYDGIDIDFYVDKKTSCHIELEFTIDFSSTRDGSYKADIESFVRAVMHKKTPRQCTVIGKDGLYTSFSTLEFFHYKSGQGFTIRAGNYGFRITKEGIQKWSGGKWVTANI